MKRMARLDGLRSLPSAGREASRDSACCQNELAAPLP